MDVENEHCDYRSWFAFEINCYNYGGFGNTFVTSKEKVLVVIDSFNGVYNMFDDLESARFINSCIMLLSSLGRDSRSSVIVTAMARKREKNDWVISPGGKQIIKSEKTGVYFLKKIEENLVISSIAKTNS